MRDAKFNAELSKQRAQAVQAALVSGGIPAAAAQLVKPANSADGTVTKEAARRAEVTVSDEPMASLYRGDRQDPRKSDNVVSLR